MKMVPPDSQMSPVNGLLAAGRRRPHWRWTLALVAGVIVTTGMASAQEVPGDAPVETEPLIVTAGRAPQDPAHTPLNVTYFDEDALTSTPALTADDFLRQVPGFSLFRRTSGLVAHPTTQGVSLRGIGPSGTSRSLVSYDGIPANDPFGGWVYWNRMDLENIERIEVVRGGGSTAWGNAALGGVIHLVPRRPKPQSLRTTASYGMRDTERISFSASDVRGPVGVLIEGRYFSTGGYKRVRSDQRGDVDIESWSRHRFLNGALEYAIEEDMLLTLRAGWFKENRGNGTPVTRNAHESGRFSARLDAVAPDGSSLELVAYGERGSSESTFSSVAADRNSETLVLDQFDIPARTVGGGLINRREIAENGTLIVGTDSRWVRGETNEFVVFAGDDRIAGGEQFLVGAFVETIYEPGPSWRFSAGGRLDYWRQFDGFMDQPNQERETFDNRDGTVFNPRIGLMYTPAEGTTVRSAVYRGFRIPTVNELYRPFQVGSDRTFANEELDPERLTGAEIGVDQDFGERVSVGVTGFWNEVGDPVANVTIDEDNPIGGVDRQRQNLDLARIRGLEVEIDFQIDENWKLFSSYAFTDARVERATNQSALEGNRLAQVPEHVIVGGIGFSHPSIVEVDLILRYNGPQFEDDLNDRKLAGFTVVDLYAARTLWAGGEVFGGVQNLFNKRYADGVTGGGLVTQGSPIFANAGLRMRF